MTDCATVEVLAPATPAPTLLERFVEANREPLREHGWTASPVSLADGSTEVLRLRRAAAGTGGPRSERALLVLPPLAVAARASWQRAVAESGWEAPARPGGWDPREVAEAAVRRLGPAAVTALVGAGSREAGLAAAVERLTGLASGTLHEPAAAPGRVLTDGEVALLRAVRAGVVAGVRRPDEALGLLREGALSRLQELDAEPPSAPVADDEDRRLLEWLRAHEVEVVGDVPAPASDAPPSGRVPLEVAAEAAAGVLQPLARDAEGSTAATDDAHVGQLLHRSRTLRTRLERRRTGHGDDLAGVPARLVLRLLLRRARTRRGAGR